MTAVSCESTPLRLQCVCQLRWIKTTRKFITTSAAVILANSFIVFRVDYYNSILAGLQTCQLDWIQSVLNSAARLITIVGHHPIIQPMCCETTYIGCVIPADRL